MLGRSRLLAAPLLLLALFGAPAQAAPSTSDRAARVAAAGEKVTLDRVELTARPDGVLQATETITYDFGADGGTGFERAFVTRIHDTEERDRTFKVVDIRVTEPYTVTARTGSDRTVVKVKGPKASGPQTIGLTYQVQGAILPLRQGQELRWTAVGGWNVPVVEAAVTAEAGVTIRNVNCFAGAAESVIGCAEFSTANKHRRARFGQQNMLPDEYLTVVAGLPAGTTTGLPTYAERKTLKAAFTVNAATGGALAALFVLLVGGVFGLYLLRGRDKRADARHRSPVGEDGFQPPNGIRPGQVGTLIDEQADVIDVTASIIDLAVRGYLLVEEDEGRGDWTLRRLKRPISDLLPYEQILYDGLFVAGDTTKLSMLGGTFSTKLSQVRRALYEDVVKQGWFARRPDAVRTRWTLAGYILTPLSVVGTVVLAVTTNLAIIGLALIAFGLALVFLGKHMPAKTGKGSAVLADTLAFRTYLQQGKADDVPDRQRIALFSRFLPYAVVFDLVGPWAKTVETAGIEGGDNLYWYEGPAEWDLSKFAESMRVFTYTLSGAISQSRPFRH
ncbi:DUF2207 domain-containing protein [Actinocorallia longicatena]|uniref:DUF2207 domain-containing protein n=1 Tax=Actinocorallia longicatena TaxID=111803 RepID=A0ABP6QEU1_9ACTN